MSGSLAAVAERRVCSILFCDLVGFTTLSQSRDPEEVRELLTRYFEESRTLIERYGGTVEKFIGDAVMAVWGAPVAREGDAERAVRAAFELVTRVAEIGEEIGAAGLAARAGVVTAEVAVTLGAVGQGMVAGDAVNTAARVQAAAPTGTCLVDEGTWRASRGSITFSPAGAHELKGKAGTTELWRADRIVSGTGGRQRIDGLEARMFGRDAELRLIKELFHASVDRKSARLVSVVGAAGVGKSRLGWEFEKYVDGLASFVSWHRGRCLSYGEGVAFWALAEMVRQRLEIAEEEASTIARAKLDTGLDRYVPDSADRAYVRPRLARLLGLADESGEPFGREELFAGWRIFFERLADVDPVVLIVEDAHHGDAGLFDFIEHLLDWAHGVPLFVLTFARPEIEERRPGWGGARRNATSMTLEPLDDRAMQTMLDDLVLGIPDDAKVAIAAQAEGVPLYAVETVRMLVDRDVVQPVDGAYRLVGDIGQLSVPDSLQSLLAARLDTLDPEARRLIADAAVLGSSFPAEALTAVSGLPEPDVSRILAELVRKEVLAVRADPLSPERGHYGFTQTLFRQVAYDTQSRRERKSRHLQVAEHLSRVFPDQGEDVAEVVAEHVLDALRAVPDDPDVPDLRLRACELLDRAGQRALAIGAPATAAESFAKAAELASAASLTDREAALRESAGGAHMLNADFGSAAAEFDSAAECHQFGDRPKEAARVRLGTVEARMRIGQFTAARQVLDSCLHVLDDDPDAVLVHGLCLAARLTSFTNDLDLAAPYLERGFSIAEAQRLDGSLFAELFAAEGGVHRGRREPHRAAASFREAARHARAIDAVDQTSGVLLNLSDCLLPLSIEEAIEPARQAIALARRRGSKFQLAMATGNLAQALVLAGDWGAVDELMTEAEREGVRQMPYCGWPAGLLGLYRGEVDKIKQAQVELAVLAGSQDPQDILNMALVDVMVAAVEGRYRDVLEIVWTTLDTSAAYEVSAEFFRYAVPTALDAAFELDEPAEAQRLLDWIRAVPRGHHFPLTAAAADLAEARLLSRISDPAAADSYANAVDSFRRYGSPWHTADALLRSAEHGRSTGDTASVTAAADEARTIAERLNCRPMLRRVGELSASEVTAGRRTPSPIDNRAADARSLDAMTS
jgi:class 3 adenylate cyclase/tetratricopeptide (TPR) repeat protein